MPGLNYDLERTPEKVRISLEGELDLHVAPELRQVLERELASPPPLVVLNLAGVPFVDSSIIATLVVVLRLLRNHGSSMRVENCQPAVRDTFEITRLTKSFGIQ